MKNLIYVKAWRGELNFGSAFWVVQIISPVVLLILAALIFKNEDAMGLIMGPYSVYSFICIIRCAKTYKKSASSTMSSVYVFVAIIWSLLFAISMVGSFVEYLLS